MYCWLIACVIGFVLDFIIGDPYFVYHPVRLIGKLIEKSEALLRSCFADNEKSLRLAGVLLVVVVCFITMGVIFIIRLLAYSINLYLGIMVEAVICYFILATRSLKVESMKVYTCLKNKDIEGGRSAVSMIVGRDTQRLDEKGIIKAAVETVAENLSDGVIAPLLYMTLGGSVLGGFYKAVNTMDSMVGYKNDRYIYFGRAAARLDDIVNFIPARFSALMLIAASFLCKKNYKNAVKIFIRDRKNHASPNSAQTEAVCAGALDIQLAGDAYYFGKLYKKPFIGDANKEVEVEDIREVNKLMYISALLSVMFLVGIICLIGEIL